MGPPLPEKLRGATATLGALSILTTALRCYVRSRIVKSWGLDDSFMVFAFIMHMWYTGTLLTGIHYGTGKPTADISLSDSVHAMRCWWLCFLAYASTITLAKISAGYFFLRITGTLKSHRVATYIVTILAALVGFAFLLVSLFQCSPVQFFWTRLAGASGKCLNIDIMIGMTYLYGSVSLVTDIAFGVLLFMLIWNLRVDRRTKVLIAPLLGMACIASYAALIRMPYIKNFKDADFLYATVDISLWSTVEVGVSVFAANVATLRPLFHKVGNSPQYWPSRNTRQSNIDPHNPAYVLQEVHVTEKSSDNKTPPSSQCRMASIVDIDTEKEAGSTKSLARSTRDMV